MQKTGSQNSFKKVPDGDYVSLLESFNFTELDSIRLGFYYHMYGNQTGDLTLQVNSGSGWNDTVWSVRGQQHSSQDLPYTYQEIDLTKYKSNNCATQLRFTASHQNPSNESGFNDGISIDQVRIWGECNSIAPGTASISRKHFYYQKEQ